MKQIELEDDVGNVYIENDDDLLVAIDRDAEEIYVYEPDRYQPVYVGDLQ
jgi:hypothetical protein